MSQLRTYRFLPILVGLALLFGAAAPTVQAACTMAQWGTQESDMPCHGPEAPITPMADRMQADGSDGVPLTGYHLCCRPDRAAQAFTATPADTTPRLQGLAAVGVLTNNALLAFLQATATPFVQGRSSPFLSSTQRQALLSTFLI